MIMTWRVTTKGQPILILLIFLAQIGRDLCADEACELLSSPENGNVNSTNTLNTTVAHYECDEGFFLYGSKTRYCDVDGNWTGEKPECISYDTCGQASNTVGDEGSITAAGAWPWHALLFRNDDNTVRSLTKENLVGEGSIINRKWILTAAHLLLYGNIHVVLGISKYRVLDPPFPPGIRIYQKRQFVRHPGYDKYIRSNDLAMVGIGHLLKRGGYDYLVIDYDAPYGEIQFGEFIRPICLPCLNSCEQETRQNADCGTYIERILKFSPNDKATVSGFGSTVQRYPIRKRYPEYLQQTEMRIQSNSKCNTTVYLMNERVQNAYLERIAYSADSMLCAVDAPEVLRDQCSGKIRGGPLSKKMVNTNTNKTCWVQIGIVSWEFGCAHSVNGHNIPSYFSNVAHGMNWIIYKMKRPRCPPVKTPTFGRTDIYIHPLGQLIGTKIEFFCDVGYRVTGPASITCNLGAIWSDSRKTTCQRIICPKIRAPSHGYMRNLSSSRRNPPKISANYVQWGSVLFACRQGYRRRGPRTITCNDNGRWSDVRDVSCVENTCQPPHDAPENGYYDTLRGTNEFKIGSEVHLRCENGYKLKGPNSITCNIRGEWSDASQTKCERSICPYVNSPRNGYITDRIGSSEVRIGTVFHFSCNIGYRLIGQQSITCNASGHWSSVGKSVCKATLCPDIEVPRNGYLSRYHHSPSRSFIPGSFVEFSCDRGYRIHGPTSVVCRSNGQWSDMSNTTCKEIKCPPVQAPENGIYVVSSGTTEFEINTTVTFVCDLGYQRMGPQSIVCRDDGLWFESNKTTCTDMASH